MKNAALLSAALALAWAAIPAPAAEKRPITVEDLLRCQRLSDPQISPDGKRVAYVLTTVDLDNNRTASSIWLVPVEGPKQPRPLTNAPGKKDNHPRWSPDGQRLLFVSNRSGQSQLWVINLSGGEARQLTNLSTGVGNGLWSPDGKHIAFVSAVFPEFSDKPFKESDTLNKQRQEEADKNPVKARVFTKLFYRHWDSYVEDRRQHLFVIPFTSGMVEPKDVTPGDRDAIPTSMTFETGDNFTFSPDGQYLVFTAPPVRNPAWNTNYDLFRVPITGGANEWECLTKDNPAADSGPAFSPDGKKLAYRAQKTPGYEADRWLLRVVECDQGGLPRGKPRDLTPSEAFDISVDEFAWATIAHRESAGTGFIFAADYDGARALFHIAANGDITCESQTTHGVHGSLAVSHKGKRYVFTHATMTAPAEFYVQGLEGQKVGIPQFGPFAANERLLAELDLPKPEFVTVKGAGGTPMNMWILKPPGFNPGKKWPLVYLVHGGPQGAWENGWHYRWNPQIWAAQGYVVALPNPRGSTGFGQKYVEEISGDWGGKCYQDLMAGVDYLEKLPFVDRERIAAAGASFGGYMVNWFAVNTGRFKTLISHAGVWNFESEYGTTDELWFDEYEHEGPPWSKKRNSYEKFSPHRLAANLGKFRTPMLLIQNDLDFRCPVGQGYELFTALQRQGVPSRFINFPDEGHWVAKPKNSQFWHREVFAWLKKWVPPGAR